MLQGFLIDSQAHVCNFEGAKPKSLNPKPKSLKPKVM